MVGGWRITKKGHQGKGILDKWTQQESYKRQTKDLDIKVEGEKLGQISKVMGAVGGQR